MLTHNDVCKLDDIPIVSTIPALSLAALILAGEVLSSLMRYSLSTGDSGASPDASTE